jgi:alpha-tubulin suppressor-like RCC1 family protein
LVSFGTLVSDSNPISGIVAGNTHSLFLNTQGIIYATGNNQHGQLGIGKGIEMCNKPRAIHSIDKVVKIQCFN